MTKFGKFLVFFNLGFSLALMIWAMGLYVNRIDWTDNPAKGDQPAGKLVERRANVAAAWYPMITAEDNWRTTRKNLLALEEKRRDTRRWYDAELAKLEKDAKPAQPTQLREVVPDITGQPDLDAGEPDPNFPNAIRVKMRPADDNGAMIPQPDGKAKRVVKPLGARNVYDLQEVEIFNGTDVKPGLLTERTRHRRGVESEVETVTRMLGPTGLHTRLQGEKAKREGVIAESEAVKPLLINTAASSSFAIEREKELRARVEELEAKRDELRRKLGVAGGPER
jgi:hypothetical protein